MGLGVNDVPIVGEPLAYGTGFIALLLVLLSRFLFQYPVTLAHEGGHMLALLVTFRGTDGWTMNDDATAGTHPGRGGIWFFTLFVAFLGYAAPSLLGLAGAALIALGNPWAVLLAAIVLSLFALVLARNALAFLIPSLIVIGFTWLLIAGSGTLQAAFATGVVWLLLFGGLLDAINLLSEPSSDGDRLAKMTFIPNFVWSLAWIFVNLTSLIVGAQLLLRPGYGLG
ncbi:M50 family metallopeptidase [Actinomycetospora sp. C-140]